MFETKTLPAQPDATSPDGSDVRILLTLRGGGTAHFELAPDETPLAVMHRTVEELWYFIAGKGEMWRRLGDYEEASRFIAESQSRSPWKRAFSFARSATRPSARSRSRCRRGPAPLAQIVEGPWKPTIPGGPL
jgi:hypothetical protein